jgi:predicted ester cyclase
MKSIESKVWRLSLSGLVLILSFAFACQDKAAMAELEKYRAQAAVEEQNKALAGRVMAAIGRADLAIIEDLVSPEFIEYTPSTTIAMRSQAEFVEHVKMIHRGVSDFSINLVAPCAEGDMVTSRYVMSGTHQGDFLGIPPTGNKFRGSGILIFRIMKGKVVELWEEFDGVGLLEQLGMELKPIEAKKK